jgi:hypothetical protein
MLATIEIDNNMNPSLIDQICHKRPLVRHRIQILMALVLMTMAQHITESSLRTSDQPFNLALCINKHNQNLTKLSCLPCTAHSAAVVNSQGVAPDVHC